MICCSSVIICQYIMVIFDNGNTLGNEANSVIFDNGNTLGNEANSVIFDNGNTLVLLALTRLTVLNSIIFEPDCGKNKKSSH